ncbi:MAG: hypothetical protein F7C38_08295 [Desulfurococcales archaeon]|nr:hypothetical protein [Desulfurococcales archaeon]
MPDWDTHARVAMLLGYKPNRKVDEVIDDLKLHDIGMRVIERPSRHPEDLISPKKLKKYRNYLEKLAYLTDHYELFYLHHAIDSLATRLTSSFVVDVKARPECILHGVRRDLERIHDNIRSSTNELRFPAPPRRLFNRIQGNYDKIVEIISPYSRKIASNISKLKEKPWEIVLYEECIKPNANPQKIVRLIESRLDLWHPSAAVNQAVNQVEGMTDYCARRIAAIRSGFSHLLLVLGSPILVMWSRVNHQGKANDICKASYLQSKFELCEPLRKEEVAELTHKCKEYSNFVKIYHEYVEERIKNIFKDKNIESILSKYRNRD